MLLLSGFQLTAFCQADDAALKNITAKLQNYTSTHLLEKAYLHFDRPYYNAGDTIYFKTYVTLGEQHELSKLSGVLDVDLISPANEIQRSIKLQLNNGLAWGDFALPDTLHTGNFRIRAYTQLMLNDNGINIFEKTIAVNAVFASGKNSPIKKNNPEVQFLPEGGELLTDIKCKVAFKATGSNGLGQNVKGAVVDNDNKEVLKFESQHLGMGFFYLIPEAGKTYIAKVTIADSIQQTVALPAAKEKEIVLAVNNDDPDKITLQIRCNKAYLDENQNKDVNLIIYSGTSISNLTTKLIANTLSAEFPKSGYNNKMLQFTLFSATGIPLSERLVFVQSPSPVNLALSTDKTTYAKNDRINLKVTAADQGNKPVEGHFSIAITDEGKVPVDENAESTILTDILLSSDLQGYVEQPNYYFNKVTDQTKANLDLVMLTHGFRRFEWKALLNDSYAAPVYKVQKGLGLTGYLKTAQGVPVTGKNIVLMSADATTVLSQETDNQGKFNFQDMSYPDSTRFVLKAGKSNGKNSPLVIVDKDKPLPVMPGNTPSGIDAGNTPQNSMGMDGGKGNVSISSKTAAIKSPGIKSIKKDSYRSSNLSGPGNADQVITEKQLSGFSSLNDALAGRLRGVDIASGVPFLQGSEVVSAGAIMRQPMLIVIDGLKQGSGTTFNNVNPSDVETVEVLKGLNAGIYGVEGGNGVIIITTKQSNARDAVSESATGVLNFMPVGFYKARTFYSPKYNAPAQSNYRRATIFWKPEVLTGTDGTAAAEFINTGDKGTYRIVIEGIDGLGNVARQVYRYKVE